VTIRLLLVIFLLSCRCFAELPPVEGELPPQPTPSVDWRQRWKLQTQDSDSDNRYLEWETKFSRGSVRRLGSAKDATAIRALLPATTSQVRWVSRSAVVVMSACRYQASSTYQQPCLYVFEKHGSKWNLTHHYRVPRVFLQIANHLTNRRSQRQVAPRQG
jgi:hypothetical protein